MQNKLYFGQAQGTPFTVLPVSVEVDWGVNSVTSELILEGNYTNEELLDIKQLLLLHCKREYDCDVVKANITKDEWQDKIAVWYECMITSPSGWHLGHSKALLSRHQHDTSTDEGQQLKRERAAIINAYLSLTNYTLSRQYSYQQWKNVVNVMIKK
eukprot:1748988-Ditylum_brightwellii.AAC.1